MVVLLVLCYRNMNQSQMQFEIIVVFIAQCDVFLSHSIDISKDLFSENPLYPCIMCHIYSSYIAPKTSPHGTLFPL